MEQLALIETGPRLTDRQRYALDELERADVDGLQTDELGALLHARNGKHSAEDRCVWCGKDGRGVLEALRAKELVRYRSRLKVWQASSCGPDRENGGPVRGMLRDDEELPF